MGKLNLLDKQDLYLQAKDFIKDFVHKGKYSSNHRLPTNRQFSKMLNVSQLTVQRAIAALAEEGLLYARRGKGTFVRDLSTATTPRKMTGLYACIIPTIQHNTVAATVHALDEVIFNSSGHHLVVCNSALDFDRELRLLDSLLQRDIDALIYQTNPRLLLYPVFLQAIDVRLQRFLAAGIPVTMLDDFAREDRYDTVPPDEQKMCELAVQHLLELGHRRILFIAHPKLFVRKIAAFRRVVAAAGLREQEVRVELVEKETSSELANEALDRALGDGWPFTAIVAATDGLALECSRVLKSRGISCPADVSIVGADNLDAIQRSEIPLTTVWCEPHEVAQQIQKVIESRLRSGGDLREAAPARTEIEPKLIVRQSTGPALLRF